MLLYISMKMIYRKEEEEEDKRTSQKQQASGWCWSDPQCKPMNGQ